MNSPGTSFAAYPLAHATVASQAAQSLTTPPLYS